MPAVLLTIATFANARLDCASFRLSACLLLLRECAWTYVRPFQAFFSLTCPLSAGGYVLVIVEKEKKSKTNKKVSCLLLLPTRRSARAPPTVRPLPRPRAPRLGPSRQLPLPHFSHFFPLHHHHWHHKPPLSITMDPSFSSPSDTTTAHARRVFSSLVRPSTKRTSTSLIADDEAGPSSSSSSSTPASLSEAHAHFEARVRDRRLQLLNPDRKRPGAAAGSVAEGKLRRREARVRGQLRGERAGKGGKGGESGGKGKGKGKERQVDTQGPQVMSRSRLRKRGLEGLDEETR